jgi:hypothetical protein
MLTRSRPVIESSRRDTKFASHSTWISNTSLWAAGAKQCPVSVKRGDYILCERPAASSLQTVICQPYSFSVI